jgi:transposase
MILSDDLRERVVEAVVLGGLSRNQAAARFKVSIASAVRWVKRFKTTGEISPAPSGGDRRSGRIEAHRDYLLGLIRRSPDVTLLEIRERLIANCGERFAVSVLWRFFDRHEITFKKKRRMPRNNNARTCKIDAGNGSRGSSISIRRNSFSLTRREPPQISHAKADVAGAGADCGRPSRTATTKR